MNQFEDDEALARLRAADPAKGAHPDLHRISERLRGRTPRGGNSIGEGGMGGHGMSSTGAGSPEGFAFSGSNDLAVHVKDPGVRTGRGGLLVAAAVAALALGGGGYALGVNTGDDMPQASPSTSTQDSGEDAEGLADSPGMSSQTESAVTESAEKMADSAEGDMGGGYAGPVIPVAGEGLSTERTTGKVYGGSGEGQWADGEAQTLLQEYADQLGIEGTVQDEPGNENYAFVFDDTTGRTLSAYSYGNNSSLDYSNPALDPSCEAMKAEMANAEPGEDFGWFGPGTGLTDIACAELGPAPDDATAIATAQEFLSQLGIDATGYSFEVQPSYDYSETVLTGDEAVATSAPDRQQGGPEMTSTEVAISPTDGPLAGFRDWHVSTTSAGISYANIQFGELVELGDYPVISPAEAVERVNDVRFQQLGAWIPDLDYYDESGNYEEWVEPEPLPPVSPGDPIPYPLSESAVISAELHTGMVSLWDGTEFIVPVYDLSDADGNHWQVMGLAEEALDFTP